MEIYSILARANDWNRERGKDPDYQILGYICDSERPFGDLSSRLERLGSIQGWKPVGDEAYVLGIALPERKREVVFALKAAGCIFCTVRAPWMLALNIEVGEGSVAAAYSIKDGMKVGSYVTLVESMLTSKSVQDYSTVLRFSNITGNVGEGSFVGNHVYSHLGKTIGDHCYVEDGSIIVKNVKSGTRVSGVPARKMKTN